MAHEEAVEPAALVLRWRDDVLAQLEVMRSEK